MNLLLFNNFYPVISHRRIQKESDELYGFGHSLWSAISCQRLKVKLIREISHGPLTLKLSKWSKWLIYNFLWKFHVFTAVYFMLEWLFNKIHGIISFLLYLALEFLCYKYYTLSSVVLVLKSSLFLLPHQDFNSAAGRNIYKRF